MRLTTELDGRYQIVHNWSERNTFEDQNKEELATRKLGQLEDIEDELGVDLITFFKAVLGFGFYSKNGFEKIEETEVDFILKCFYTIDQDKIYFKDYGKTWALTKEELL